MCLITDAPWLHGDATLCSASGRRPRLYIRSSAIVASLWEACALRPNHLGPFGLQWVVINKPWGESTGRKSTALQPRLDAPSRQRGLPDRRGGRHVRVDGLLCVVDAYEGRRGLTPSPGFRGLGGRGPAPRCGWRDSARGRCQGRGGRAWAGRSRCGGRPRPRGR